jgi:UDP-N-acetyl-D-mannosaminuronic acid dehydrogenase
VLGYSYLEGSEDTRNSPSAALVSLLEEMGCAVTVHDPLVPGCGGDVVEAARDADCAVAMVAHRAYRSLDMCILARAMRRPLLVDTRAVFDTASLRASPFSYRVLGAGPGTRAVARSHA